jgi:hypothetical protein
MAVAVVRAVGDGGVGEGARYSDGDGGEEGGSGTVEGGVEAERVEAIW